MKRKLELATITTSLARFREEVAPGFLSLSLSSVSPGDAAQLAPQTTTTTTSNSAASDGNSSSASCSAAEAEPAPPPAAVEPMHVAPATRRLRPLLSAAERQAANLMEEYLQKKKKSPEPKQAVGGKKPREKGEKSPGLSSCTSSSTRRPSNFHTIIRQKEQTRLADRGVQEMDDVVVWAYSSQSLTVLPQ